LAGAKLENKVTHKKKLRQFKNDKNTHNHQQNNYCERNVTQNTINNQSSNTHKRSNGHHKSNGC